MKNILEKIKILTTKKQLIYLILSFFLVIITGVLETISLGSIAGFVYFISEPELVISKIPNDFEVFKRFVQNKSKTDLTIYFAALLVLFFLLKNIVVVLYHYFVGHLKKNINVSNTNKLLKKYLNEDYSFFSENSSQELINNLNAEIVRCSHYIFFVITFFKEIVLIIFLFITLIYISWKITSVIFLILALFSYIFYLLFRNYSQKFGKGISRSSESILKNINDSIKNFQLIKLLNLEDFFVSKVSTNVDKRNTFQLNQTIINLLPRYLLEIVAVLIVTSIICFFVFSNYSFESMISLLTLITLIVIKLVPSISNVNVVKTNLKHYENSFKNVSHQLKDYKNHINAKKNINTNNNKIDFHSLEIKNLSFQYKGKKNYLLHKINFKINKGDVLGVIGESGVGKSTLINIILGLLKFDQGEIFINGKILHKKFFDLKNFIGYVPQETYLMNESIKSNIIFGYEEEEINSTKLKGILKKTNLLDFVNGLVEKQNTFCGDNGISLSGGQRQRIGIARALYSDPELLILDEATSALDEETENQIFNDILKIENKTMIVVTHRKNLLQKCTKIILLKANGKFYFGDKVDIIQKLNS